MSGKAIFEEFGKLLAKEQENRELLKLGQSKIDSHHHLSESQNFILGKIERVV